MQSSSPSSKSQAIRVALLGFDNPQEQAQLTTLFAHAQRWQKPWQIVADPNDADFLLVASDDTENLTELRSCPEHFAREQIIAYTGRPSDSARWYLKRPGAAKMPSPLEFTILLKEMGKAFEDGLVGRTEQKNPTKNLPAQKKHFDWRERLKVLIIGSVGSGKTTAINTLSQGNAVSTEAKPSDHTQLQKKSTTVAMDFGTLAIDSETQLLVYGAPGQRRFDFMSGILIQNALGIIILISNESSNTLSELNYYLDSHRDFLADHHAVIGITHNDLNPKPSLNEYAAFIQSRGESWPVLKVDARKHEDMKKLVGVLLETTFKRG
ncbi:hypothetical protein JCM14076_08960 [Methylosoma difficile]